MLDIRLMLASQSPRRRELLTQAGLKFTVEAADLNEEVLPGEAAAAYVQRLALEKAQAVCARHQGGERVLVLGADTTVVTPDGEILGKPVDAADAARMLGLLSGRTHVVMTGLAVVWSEAGGQTGFETLSDVELTQVTMNLISADEIASYIASGEPLDKAGAYAIQGLAARWVTRIEGDYSNVVGLPLARVIAMLAEAGLPQGY